MSLGSRETLDIRPTLRARVRFGLVAGIVLAHLLAVLVGYGLGVFFDSAPIPACQEDELIQGTGDYHDGEWSGYGCVHPDTLPIMPGRIVYLVEVSDGTVEGYSGREDARERIRDLKSLGLNARIMPIEIHSTLQEDS